MQQRKRLLASLNLILDLPLIIAVFPDFCISGRGEEADIVLRKINTR